MTDPITSNPQFYSVLFENDRVRVLQYLDAPGDATQPHSHPDSVMITLSSFRRRLHSTGRDIDVEIPRFRHAGWMSRSTPGRTPARLPPTPSLWS